MELKFNFESDLIKLIDCDALEIYSKDDIVYIPFMMNDAVECYYVLSGCKVMGELKRKYEGELSVDMVENQGRQGLIIHQGYDQAVTIWYSDICKKLELYQYHRIAHIWVKGQEKWRRLVYIIGTIHDKINFLGPEYSNEFELSLVGLMGFAPFRYWTPIHESLDEYYINTSEGLATMKYFAERINDAKFSGELARFSKEFENGYITNRSVKRMAKVILKNDELFRLFNETVEKASSVYNTRAYDSEKQAELERLKIEACNKLEAMGYAGEYPLYKKGKQCITLYEEHPYVMQAFEYDNFGFSINGIEE